MEYRERFKTCLINPTEVEIFERDPISAFSFYLSGRVAVLSSFSDEIVDNLEAGFAEEIVDGSRIERAESLMWLWLLGAYEVIRTMHQAKQCFSERVLGNLGILKKQLSIVRMPAAKMEKAGKNVPVTSSRSPFGWNISKRDLILNDPEDSIENYVYARSILAEFDRVVSGIQRADILLAHEASYCQSPLPSGNAA